MDKNILTEYAGIKKEIQDLRRRIEEGRRELKRLNQADMEDSRIDRRKAALEKRIERHEILEAELLKKQTETEEYIESIPQAELRMIFRHYYIDNLTWYQVAFRMNDAFPARRVKYTEDSCRMRHKRFLKKIE